jgi:hypothetical protein
MVKRINYGKVAVVVFITLLVWVWADLALNETLPDRPAVIEVDQSASPKLWVSFSQASSADIKLTLSGPHTAITDVSRKLKEGGNLEFYLDAAQEKMNEPGNYTLNLLPFLQKSNQIKRLGLKVESCRPETLPVDVVECVKMPLTVKCLDEDQNPIDQAVIEPAQVEMLVPANWPGEKRVAKVLLTKGEIEQAKLSPIEKKPCVELVVGQTKESPRPVKITIPARDELGDYTIPIRLGFSLSANLQGRYNVEVTNLDAVMTPVGIRATPEAKRAYENMRFQVLLEIDDEDVKVPDTARRELVYNFPQEYVRKGEIRLKKEPPPIAQFKLIPLSSVGSSPAK